MTSADIHADRLLRGVELMEDPWAAMRPEGEARDSRLGAAGLHVAAGLWGIFLATALWWSYALATVTQPAMTIAQAN